MTVLEMNQYSATAMAGATVTSDYLFSGRSTHSEIVLYVALVSATHIGQENHGLKANRNGLYH
jgi:hypothetical protein